MRPSRFIPGRLLDDFDLRAGPPLVISLSAPLRMTSARSREPDPCIAAVKPAAIDSTDTNTTTTPAMPTIATAEELRRCGIVRMFSAMTASVCRSQSMRQLLRSASVIFSRIARDRRQQASEHAHRRHQPDAKPQIAGRQHEDGSMPLVGSPLWTMSQATRSPRPPARTGDEE